MSDAPGTAGDVVDPGRFRLLAAALASRPVGVTTAALGDPPHTDGVHIFVSADQSVAGQRREVLVQAALLGGGSLDPDIVKSLWGHPWVARRYLALEGRRALAELRTQVPAVTALPLDGPLPSGDPEESLRLAQGRSAIADPPEWFGQIRPSRLLGQPAGGAGGRPKGKDLRLDFNQTDVPDADEDEEFEEPTKLLKLFQNNARSSNTLASFFSKFLGMVRTPSQSDAGGELSTGSMRRADKVGPHARPLAVPLRLAAGSPGRAGGVGGALYPEWDVDKGRYRPEWCRVIEFPVAPAPDISQTGVERDEMLRRRLARLGLGPKVIRRQPDGDDLDVDALIDLAVDLRAGHSPAAEHVYLERRKLARDLGVLILLDASGSATETDLEGRSVHEHQRRAAATLAVTLEELGDRVAVYAFRSQGRASVHLLALKPFATRFGAGGRGQLNQLQPAGYTRLGAAVRHAGEILKTQAGTPNRLLIVLSDGFPYDQGYEGQYGEADAHRALFELRHEGVACLCLSIGASTPVDALERVFGSASHAGAPTLAKLSHRMDELFLGALKELAAPNPGAHKGQDGAGSFTGRTPRFSTRTSPTILS